MLLLSAPQRSGDWTEADSGRLRRRLPTIGELFVSVFEGLIRETRHTALDEVGQAVSSIA